MNNPSRFQTLAALGGFAAGVLGVSVGGRGGSAEAPAPRIVFRDAPRALPVPAPPEARWIVRRPAMETLLAEAEPGIRRIQEPPSPPPTPTADRATRPAFTNPEEETAPDQARALQAQRSDPLFASAGPPALTGQSAAPAAAILRAAPRAPAPAEPAAARAATQSARAFRSAPRAAALQALVHSPDGLQRLRGLPTFAELVKSFEEDSRALGPLSLAAGAMPIRPIGGEATGGAFAVGGTGMVIPGSGPAPATGPASPNKGAGGAAPPSTLKPLPPLSSVVPLVPPTPAVPPAPIPWQAGAQQQGLLFPDISVWNNVGNWDALAKASHGIIVMKVRQTHVDKLFNESLTEAEKRKMIVIGYAFGYGADGGQQADAFVLNFPLKPGRIMMLDLERNTFGPTMNDSQAVAFVQRIHARTGKYPMLYTSASRPRPGVLARCPRYVAKWSSGAPDGAAIWQYTNGQIGPTPHTYPGIGHCDINRLMITYAKLRQLAGLDAK